MRFGAIAPCQEAGVICKLQNLHRPVQQPGQRLPWQRFVGTHNGPFRLGQQVARRVVWPRLRRTPLRNLWENVPTPLLPTTQTNVTAVPTFFQDAAALRAWFAEHSAHASELIVGFVKTHTGRATLTWPQAVDEALCFGWIDGVRTSIDKNHYKIRFSPRESNSKWSAVNIKRVPELEADGRMTKAGLDVFALRTEANSRTGSYEQEEFPELSAAEVAAFKKNKSAWVFYEKLPPSYRRKVNWLIISAKLAATRTKRFNALVAACAEGRRDY